MTSIAIVAMDCVFPGAGDLETYWQNLVSAKDSISLVPAQRWDPVFYDPTSKETDRFYCRRGGFVDEFASFDPLEYGIMPLAAEGAEPEQLLTLKVAARALTGVKLPAREKCGVILGRGNYIGAGMNRLIQHARTAEQLASALRDLVPDLTADQIEGAKREFRSKLGRYGADTAIGLVPNLTSSRIANRLDFRGPVYTLDAACASSLIAVERACREIESGRCDLMVAGGVHLTHDVTFWSVFTQMGALSRNQVIRPFDRRADGLLIGEGVGVLVLKRLEQAQKDGDQIYAVIRGAGVASDGRAATLMEPSPEGQRLAIERAWAEAGLSPASLGQLEAHGTGTIVGDQAELRSVQGFFGAKGELVTLGSVKSMIGHAMPAAGAAGLIKMALALHHRRLLPSLNCEEPRAELTGSRFQVSSVAREWGHESGARVAAVNAFGFGGINAHLVLEEFSDGPNKSRVRPGVQSSDTPSREGFEPVLVLSALSEAELLQALVAGKSLVVPSGNYRLAIFAPTPEKIEKARTIIQKGQACRGIQGIWYVASGLLQEGGKIAFMFPGIDSGVRPDVSDVARYFGIPLAKLPGDGDLESRGMEVFQTSDLFTSVLGELKIIPEAIFGHSLGEWGGVVASGLTPQTTVTEVIERLRPGMLPVPGVVFAALGCGVARAREVIEGLRDVQVSHDNCPHQSIICGIEKSVDEALTRLKNDKIMCQKLDFRSGFHTSLFAPFIGPLEKSIRTMSFTNPKVPLWSATTCKPYPADESEVRDLMIRHLLEPVRFQELTEALYQDGFRVFVQVGAGSLQGFIDDTLRGKPHQCLTTVAAGRTGLAQLQRFCLALFAEGADFDLSFLLGRAETTAPTPSPAKGTSFQLKLGEPLVRLSHPLQVSGRSRLDEREPQSELFAELRNSFAEIQSASLEITDAFHNAASVAKPFQKQITRLLTIEERPELLDHSFYKQKKGWTNLSDLFPVMPMTGTIDLITQISREQFPEHQVVAIENIVAIKWLAVEAPREVTFAVDFDGKKRLKFELKGHFSATVVLSKNYDQPPAPALGGLTNFAPAKVRVENLYRDGWMFHGPAYQCVSDLSGCGDNGIDGKIRVTEVPGALMDNAGQLFGYWVMERTTEDRYAMPVRIKKIEYFAPQPRSGEVTCKVRIEKFRAREVLANLELTHAGHVWSKVTGWEDWRFECDTKLWDFLMAAGRTLLSDDRKTHTWLERKDPTPAACDDFSKRYLREAERKVYEGLGPRKDSWIFGRVAAKDAIRAYLWSRGYREDIFPAEIWIENNSAGRPLVVEAPGGKPIFISIAHKRGLAVACAGESPELGIDVERIEPRGETFEHTLFTDSELALLPGRTSPQERSEWVTRFWGAKEAYAKSKGLGLQGRPKSFLISQVGDGKILVADRWITSRKLGDLIISQTET